jgi:hypothetical protein
MTKNRSHSLLVVTSLCVALALVTGSAFAQGQGNGRQAQFEVTIINLTGGQTLSPPLVASHQPRMALFLVGEPALPELATLAEEGDPAPFAALLEESPDVFDVAVGDATVPPGESTTITIQGNARGNGRNPLRSPGLISAVAMLSDTNDAFFGLDGITPPQRRGETVEVFVDAYDAGSETNNEACGFIPGPSCDGAGAEVRDEAEAEGFVHIHGGVQGIADLEASDMDWRNPVVKIVITRVR